MLKSSHASRWKVHDESVRPNGWKVIRWRGSAALIVRPSTCHVSVFSLPSVSPPLSQTMFGRSEEHTSELQSLMRISYAVFCLTKNTTTHHAPTQTTKANTLV